MTIIFVDADACPAKNEVYRVAERFAVATKVVSNMSMRIPESPLLEMVVVGEGFDAADDWIVDHVSERDVVVTDDIPLASRCVKKGAQAISAKGRIFAESSIGEALATREMLSQLREHGLVYGGPGPYQQKDRSRFLQRLDQLVRSALSR